MPVDVGEVPVQEQSEFTKKIIGSLTQTIEAAPASNEQWIIDTIWCNGSDSVTIQIQTAAGVDIDGYYFIHASETGFVLEDKHLKQIPIGQGFRIVLTGSGTYGFGLKYHKKVK